MEFDTVYTDNIERSDGRGAPNFPLGITVSGISTLSGNVSIGGTLTYEDVTNVDSIGVVTARNGIKVTTGGIDVTAGAIVAGAGVNVTSGNVHVGQGGAGSNNGELKIQAGASTGNDIIAFLNQAGSTRGNITYDTDNNFVLFNVNAGEKLRIGSAGQIGLSGANYGTSGQVMTSQGASAAPQWADAGGGAWELLSSISNPNTSTVDFTGLTTSYAAYKVHFNNVSINTNNSRQMRCRMYLNGTLKTSDYRMLSSFVMVGAGSVGAHGGSTNAIVLAGQGQGGRGFNGELTFPMKLRTTGAIDSLQAFYGTCVSHDTCNTIGGFNEASYSTLLTGIQFDSPDNYNVTDGQFYLYGLTRT